MAPLSDKLPELVISTNNPNPFFLDYNALKIPKDVHDNLIKKMHYKPEIKKYNIYEPKKIIYNGKATVVFWKDGTKTVVKMAEGTNYSKYNAFCAALAKKIFGSNSAVNRTVNSGIEQK